MCSLKIKSLKFVLVICCLTPIFIGKSVAKDVTEMIKKADHYRLDSSSSKVTSIVKLFENEELDKTREYHVYTRPNRESLVVFKSAVEVGQKMLMLGDNYWLVMPKSRRPIRITPMQKLLGEASIGDISTLTWSDDYNATLMSRESITLSEQQNVDTYKLELVASTKGASYQTIELWLDASNDFPVKANLYLRSGKLAKQAIFSQGLRDDKLRVVAMTLIDKIQPAKKTIINYIDIVPMELAEKYYNPAYLTRNSVLEL
ncbi:outer membrane lipoprotein-sorting protein [Vibrio algarum]|uniref:Outer membrane lipoprotein-sorting protein n=1 Tax=Vibrio algarum TaxID=3020714 RepID=A0ABT4YSL3_9VIBR|nr:outer membrane lipoprotein-sorting protein [Vibrio sp. KJ40-1]MDB1124049.1 outer membrane lipoprotein-sorting protein [Vibrio sp. KJ40-1]